MMFIQRSEMLIYNFLWTYIENVSLLEISTLGSYKIQVYFCVVVYVSFYNKKRDEFR